MPNRPPYGDEFRRLSAMWNLLKVEAQYSPDMTVKVKAGGYWVNGESYVEYTGGSSTSLIKPTSGAKWVVIALSSSAQLQLLEGTSGVNPTFPSVPKRYLPLAAVYLQSTTSSVKDDMIYDMRPWLSSGGFPTSHNELSDRTANNSHPISAIDGLQDALDLKVETSALTAGLANKPDLDGTPSEVWILNKDETGVPSADVLLQVNRGSEVDVGIRWNEVTQKWEFTNDGSAWYELSNAGFIDNATGTIIGKSRLSLDPVDLNDPVAVGDNDPRLMTTVQLADVLAHITNTSDPHSTLGTHSISFAMLDQNLQDGYELKAERVVGVVVGNIAALDSTGDLMDSGINIDDLNMFNMTTTVLRVDGNRTDSYAPTGTIAKPFKTIQAAINSAIGETLVLIAPGTYTENLTLKEKVHLQAKSIEQNGSTIVEGTVSFNAPAGTLQDNTVSLTGLDIAYNTASPIQFTGANPQRLILANTHAISNGLSGALASSNTGAGSEIIGLNSTFENTSTGLAADINVATLNTWNSKFLANTATSNAVEFAANATANMMNDSFVGSVQFDATSGGRMLSPVIDSAANPNIIFNSTGTVQVSNPFTINPAPLAGGSNSAGVDAFPKSSAIPNQSAVTGSTVTDALNALNNNKADKVSSATNGNLAGLNASGNLTDSGSSPSSFDAAGTAASAVSTHESTYNHGLLHSKNNDDQLRAGLVDCDTSGNLSVTGELKVKMFSQGTEPTLHANQFFAIWEDTVGGKVYMLYRTSAGSQVKVELA